MHCPYCLKITTAVVNSRASKANSQIWRRRKCLACEVVFTTHEIIDISHIIVTKRTGESEMFSRMKLYSGIFYASQSSKISHREVFIDTITRSIEQAILHLKKKKITSDEIAEITLMHLKKKHTPTFLRFLTNCKNINTEAQMKREFAKYL